MQTAVLPIWHTCKVKKYKYASEIKSVATGQNKWCGVRITRNETASLFLLLCITILTKPFCIDLIILV